MPYASNAQKIDTIRFDTLKSWINKTDDYNKLLDIQLKISDAEEGSYYVISGATYYKLDSLKKALEEKILFIKYFGNNYEEDIVVVEEEINVDTSIIEQSMPVLMVVEVMPSYPGGDDAMYKFFAENIKYPQIAKDDSIAGKVVVTFVVEKDGRISCVRLLKDIGGGCGEEAVRVIKMMPAWKPGKQNGEPVRVQFNIPIMFSLE